jgi:Tfp pilus assembly protein PilW
MDCKIISTSFTSAAQRNAGLRSAAFRRQTHQTPSERLWTVPALLQPTGGAPVCRRPVAAFTLLEVMIASALALVAMAAVGSFSWFSSRSFVAMTNYVELDQNSQFALDKMSREIRQAHRLDTYSPTSLTFVDAENNPLTFTYDADARTLSRVSGGQTNILLTGCDFLQFSKYQHTAISNTFDAYEPAYVTNTKMIQVSWVCSRKILGAKVNTESVQSAKIALRNNLSL